MRSIKWQESRSEKSILDWKAQHTAIAFSESWITKLRIIRSVREPWMTMKGPRERTWTHIIHHLGSIRRGMDDGMATLQGIRRGEAIADGTHGQWLLRGFTVISMCFDSRFISIKHQPFEMLPLRKQLDIRTMHISILVHVVPEEILCLRNTQPIQWHSSVCIRPNPDVIQPIPAWNTRHCSKLQRILALATGKCTFTYSN